MNMKFYITFSYDSIFKKSYIIIQSDYETARRIASQEFKNWANIYAEDVWLRNKIAEKHNLTMLGVYEL